jgi:hypothetical protein
MIPETYINYSIEKNVITENTPRPINTLPKYLKYIFQNILTPFEPKVELAEAQRTVGN